MRKYRIAWLTASPDPLQRSLLEAVAKHPAIDLEVFFCGGYWIGGRPTGRTWNWQEGVGDYSFRWLGGLGWRGLYFNPEVVSVCVRNKHDLFIVTSYAKPTMQLAMAVLSLLRRRWAIWGERPGMNPQSIVRNFLRRMALFLPKYYAACGIGTGTLAMQAFRELFSDHRPVYSLPYLISLESFLSFPLPERSEPVRFLFSGQLIPRKGIDVLCKVAAKLFYSGMPVKLMVLGDGPERSRIEALRREFPDRVHCYGFLPFEDRRKAYSDADVFIFPSYHEGWGVAVHEAMARGLPVITSETVGSAYDLVEYGVNGFVIKAGDIEGFYQAMQFFIQNPQEIRQFGMRAREKASQYTISWGVSQLLKILSDFEEYSVDDLYSSLFRRS